LGKDFERSVACKAFLGVWGSLSIVGIPTNKIGRAESKLGDANQDSTHAKKTWSKGES
jgi:hypothetical protein